MRNPKQCGEIGETAFLHRATTLGLLVSRPFGESGRYDFVVDNGRRFCRVQVKSTATRNTKSGYNVKAGRHLYTSRRRTPNTQASSTNPVSPDPSFVPYLASEIDFLVVYLIPEDAWYIFPIAVLNGRTSLSLSAHCPTSGPFAPYANAWHLLQE